MRRSLVIWFAALLALVAAPAATFAQDATPEPPTDEMRQLADDTYAFVSSNYVSLVIVTPEGVITTEPGSQFDTERAARLEAAIAAITDQPVRYLIYSHDHSDHSTGGAVFADTATFVSHRDAVAKIAALNDPNTPVPTLAFDDYLQITLGGTTIELYFTGRNHSDNSIVLLHPAARILFAVDFIPVDSLPFQNLRDAYPEEWIASLSWVEENLDFDTLVIGHPPVQGTKADVGEIRGYLEALIAAVRDAQAQGLADNSPEMIAAVRATLEPTYGGWNNFEEWLPLNIEGLLAAWAAQGAAATPTT